MKNFSLRQFYFKFFDKRRYVVIGDYFALPLFDSEDLLRYTGFIAAVRQRSRVVAM